MPETTAAYLLRSKQLTPSARRTADWDLVSAQIRERSFFMAAVENAKTLQEFRKAAASVVNGAMSPQEARRTMRDLLRQAGYTPEEGKEGTIHDLSSTRRLKVSIDTNARMAAGWANRQAQLGDPAFPAQELVRIRQSKARRDWNRRWAEAAAAVKYDGVARSGSRMIARLDSPIWVKISRFGHPYPPFDFGSGMGVLPVSAKDCDQLGLSETQAPLPEPSLNQDISADMGDAETARLAEQAAPGVVKAMGNRLIMPDLNGTSPRTAAELADAWAKPLPDNIQNYQQDAMTEWVNDNRYFDLNKTETDNKGKTPLTETEIRRKETLTRAFKDVTGRLPNCNGADNRENALYRALSWDTQDELDKFLAATRATGTFSIWDKHLAESFSSSRANTEAYVSKRPFQLILVYDDPHQAKDIRPLYKAMPASKQNVKHPLYLEAEYLLPEGVTLAAGNALQADAGKDGTLRYVIHVRDTK